MTAVNIQACAMKYGQKAMEYIIIKYRQKAMECIIIKYCDRMQWNLTKNQLRPVPKSMTPQKRTTAGQIEI